MGGRSHTILTTSPNTKGPAIAFIYHKITVYNEIKSTNLSSQHTSELMWSNPLFSPHSESHPHN